MKKRLQTKVLIATETWHMTGGEAGSWAWRCTHAVSTCLGHTRPGTTDNFSLPPQMTDTHVFETPKLQIRRNVQPRHDMMAEGDPDPTAAMRL